MRNSTFRKHERGMALIIALLLLLLVSAVGLGMIYMSTTETSINTNYKDTQTGFFAMRAGLEEMRDRMRSSSAFPIALPTTMPGTANSIVYIINPSSAADTVDPKSFLNQYFDDEFCHESFVLSGVAYVPPGTPCQAIGAPPAGSVAAYVTSQSPYNTTAASLKYKWVRITLKQNGTFPNALVDPTQTGLNLASPVCWDGTLLHERVASAMVPGAMTCTIPKNAGFNVQPVYLITSLAITPQGSRRVGQYEAGAYMVTPPAAGLDFAGPNAQFNNAPNSNNFGISGCNSGDPANNALAPAPCTNAYVAPVPAGAGGPGSCTMPTPAVLTAIAVGDAQGVTNMDSQIPGNRTGMYTGAAPIAPAPAVPSVQNEGVGTASYPSNNVLGPGSNWSTPAQMNQLAQAMANEATITCPGSAACASTTFGTDAAPQITYITGDATLSGGAGVVVVTGTLTFNGNTNFDGLVLVIGQGIMNVKGGGGGQINGEVLIAKTNNPAGAQLATLGSPSLNWTGGGSNFIQYNSCWADFGSYMQYTVVASREEMY